MSFLTTHGCSNLFFGFRCLFLFFFPCFLSVISLCDTWGAECGLDSDCWDVKLKFFDPENSRRAKKLFRFTIDVSDIIPVTLGEVRSWSTPY